MEAVLEKAKPTIRLKSSTEQDIFSSSRRFTVDEYHRMGEAGILHPDERVELIEGVICRMSPKGFLHSTSVEIAREYFAKKLKHKAHARTQDPIYLSKHSEPEPDVALVVPPFTRYRDHHPTPAEIFLVFEVADTTLNRDRRKGKTYAKAGIVQYCILDLKHETIEEYSDPTSDGYGSKNIYRTGDKFALVAFPAIVVKVKDLLEPDYIG
jgi:Uma2 family endonuclease